MNKFSLLLVMILLLFSCNKQSDEVVVYTTVDQVFSEPVLKKFEAETGIKVKAVYDTEETKSTGVLNRLIAEKNHPRADVFWSGDPVRTLVLKEKGITAPYLSPNAQGIPEEFIDPEHHWTGFSARARVLIYNKKRLPDSLVPHSIFQLTDSAFKGQVAVANPLFGTTTFHIAALFTVLGDEKAKKFMSQLKNNQVIIASGNGDVKKRVLQGEIACGLTDTDDAFEAMKESDDSAYLFLDQEGMGTLVMPNMLSMIKDAPNPGNATKLIDFLLRKDTEEMLAESCAQMPLHKGVKTPRNIPSLDQIKPMKIDYQLTARKLLEIQNYLKKWVED